jgi:hypothetical protein
MVRDPVSETHSLSEKKKKTVDKFWKRSNSNYFGSIMKNCVCGISERGRDTIEQCFRQQYSPVHGIALLATAARSH